MGIRSTFSGDSLEIDVSSLADEMLAKVVADFAQQRFHPANQGNRVLAGDYVPYTVAINGRVIHRGRGVLFPQQQVEAVAAPVPGRVRVSAATRIRNLTIEWAWDRIQTSLLERAVAAIVKTHDRIGQIEDAASFSRAILLARDDATDLLKFLLERYARAKYPVLFQTMDDARALYRVYRIVRLAGSLFGGSDRRSEADVEVLAWIARELRDRSPVLSGQYRDAHALYGDGRLLMDADDVTSDSVIEDAEEYSFTNTLPYARKIEFGQTESGRDFVMQVPNRIYERLAADARARFGSLADISFEMRAVIGGEQTPQPVAQRQHNRPPVRYPSIVVTF